MQITTQNPTIDTPVNTLVAKSLTGTAAFKIAAIEIDEFSTRVSGKTVYQAKVRKVDASKGGLWYPLESLFIIES